MADLAEDPLAPDWGEIDKGNPRAVSDALWLIWQRMSAIENDPIVQSGYWTPVDGSGAGLAFPVAIGTWIKIKQLVILSFNVTYPATANGANGRIGGMPYYTQSVKDAFWGGFVTWGPLSGGAAIVNNLSMDMGINTFGLALNQNPKTNAQLASQNYEGVIIYVTMD